MDGLLAPPSRGCRSWISLPQCIMGQARGGDPICYYFSDCFNQTDKKEPLTDAQTDWNSMGEERDETVVDNRRPLDRRHPKPAVPLLAITEIWTEKSCWGRAQEEWMGWWSLQQPREPPRDDSAYLLVMALPGNYVRLLLHTNKKGIPFSQHSGIWM